MKHSLLFLSFCISLILFLSFGCKDDPKQGIYDPNFVPAGTPQITSVAPENAPYYISRVTTVVINGSNFSTDTSKNLVYFGVTPATVLSASPTQLKVKTPNIYGDSISLRIAVQGAEKFSATKILSIKPSILIVSLIDSKAEKPYAITVDKNNILYVSVTTAAAVGLGVKKIIGDTLRSDFSNRTADNEWSGLKMGSGDTLYGVRNLAAIFTLRQNANPGIFINGTTNGSLSQLRDLDFDSQKNMWMGGLNTSKIYRVNRNKAIRSFPFVGDVRSVRVYNNALFISGKSIVSGDTIEGVFKFPFVPSDTSLGAMEVYFSLKSSPRYSTSKAFAITFDNAGGLYLGTDHTDGIIKIESDKTYSALYGGLIGPMVTSMAWGTGNIMYVIKEPVLSTDTQTLLRVDMQRQSSVYYGRE